MLVTVIIPTLNEENYINECLDSILTGLEKFSKFEKEILIIDGNSEDNTLKILNEYKEKFNFIRIYENKKKTAPAALNIGINQSTGKYIIRCDAHASYPENYFEDCIDTIKKSSNDVMNIGGYVKTKNKTNTIMGKTIAAVLSNIVGVGNSHFRIYNDKNEKYELREVDTVPFGCFKREIFNKIGLFNEIEPGNEDIEFNNRIIKSGYKILLNTKIYSIYYSRPNIKNFFKQSFNNGWITTKNRNFTFRSFRHYVPLLFFTFVIFSVINFFYIENNFLSNFSIFILILYFLFVLYGSILNFLRSKQILIFIYSFFIFLLLHFTYGLGSFLGLMNINASTNNIYSYDDFLKISFPLKNPFVRHDKDFLTNLIKYISLKISYVLYRLNISANLVDYLSAIIFFIGAFFLFQILEDKNINLSYFAIFYFAFGLILFIDFVDGQLARVGDKFLFGNDLDNLNPDLVRFVLIIFPSLINTNNSLLIFSLFSAVVQNSYYYIVKEKMIERHNFFMKFYFFIHGLRFLYLIMTPVLIFLFIFKFIYLDIVTLIIVFLILFLNLSLIIMSSKIKNKND